MRPALPAAALLSALLGATASQAATVGPFEAAKVPVHDAHQLFNEPDDRQLTLGQPLVLTLQATPRAKALDGQALRLRIFALGAGQTEPTPWAFLAPCYVYLSSLTPLRSDRGIVNLGPLGSPHWLQLDGSGQRLQPGHHLLVVEADGDADPLLRLNQDGRADYFRRGLRIEVRPDGRGFSAEELRRLADEIARTAAEARRRAQDTAQQHRCYSTQLAEADLGPGPGDGTQLALLDGCDTRALTP